MTVRVDVAPELFAWAAERSRRDSDYLAEKFPRLAAWQRGQAKPTLKQLEAFARATYTPLGRFFLEAPSEDAVPVPDFRTLRDEQLAQPSPNLLDTIYLCEQRQEWYQDFARATGEPELAFVGSLTTAGPVDEAADAMRRILGLDVEARRAYPTWQAALRGLVEHAEEAGVLVMVSGVTGSNTHRPLDPDEFRGFALVDKTAPLVFVNGADTKAAQIFTLSHELVHVWLGASALSNSRLNVVAGNELERWCSQVAAELLVPLASLREKLEGDEELEDALARLARIYKVSTLVILRRLFDADILSEDAYWEAFQEELERVLELSARSTGGGDFYHTQPARVSRRFARAVITDTLEGRTLHRDAFRLLGFKKASTFEELGQRLGVT